MILAFIGQNKIDGNIDKLKSCIKWYLNFYSTKDELTVLCGNKNRYDDIVRECVAELIGKTVLPVKLCLVVADCKKITQDVLDEYCDLICIYPSYSKEKQRSIDYSIDKMIMNSDRIIFYVDSALNNAVGLYYRRALSYGKVTVNMYKTIEKVNVAIHSSKQ